MNDSFPADPLLLLRNGERFDQPTLHRLYEATPEDFRAELIAGVVHVRGRTKASVGSMSASMCGWLSPYQMSLPHVQALARVTIILGPTSEVEPNATLIVLPECGGATHDQDDYLAGPPELIVEVADGSNSSVLAAKRIEYERYGVGELICITMSPDRIEWLTRQDGRFIPLEPASNGVIRSRVFPGLWLDPQAILADDTAKFLEVARQGVATPEFREFAMRLAIERRTP